MSTEERTLYITGLEERVDKEILEELFDQVSFSFLLYVFCMFVKKTTASIPPHFFDQ